jgi:colicin import membrane protein
LITSAFAAQDATTPTDAPSDQAPGVVGSGFTVSQENAIESAQNYLSTQPFSESGLIEQLEFEGYSKDDASSAVGHIEVDWNDQAARSAANYLDTMPFSRSGLIEQLEFEGFTHSQATYGVNTTGL